jgi:PAS domain S-box-containing protein
MVMSEVRPHADAAALSPTTIRALIRALDEGVVFLDPAGTVAAASAEMALADDRPGTATELEGAELGIVRPDGSPFPLDEHPGLVAQRTGRSVRGVEVGLPAANGDGIKWRLVNADPVYDRDRRLAGVVVSAVDSRVNAMERALLTSHARVAPAAHALARLEELTSRLWQAATLEEGLELVLSAATELLRTDLGSVWLVTEDGGQLRIAAQRGLSSAALERFGELSIPVETEPGYIPFLDIARSAGYGTLRSTPLFGRNDVFLGTVLTHFRPPHRPSRDDLGQLDLYARQAAAFIERCRDEARLREKEGRLRLALEASSEADASLAEARARLAIFQQRAPLGIGLKSMADGSLISANETFLELFELTHEEVIGKTCLELGILDADTHQRIDEPLRARRPVHDLEITHRTRSSAERILSLNWDPVTITGHEYVVASVLDLTARKHAEEAIRTNDERHTFLAALTDALRSLTDPADIQGAATRLLAQKLGAERVTYAEVVGEREVIIHRDYASGVPSMTGRYPLGSFGPELVAAARRGENVVVDDIATDARLSSSSREAFQRIRATALMSAHLVKGGKLVAGLSVHSSVPRVWTPFEIDLLNETADRAWAAVEQAHADHRLRESQALLRLALDASQASCWSLCATSDTCATGCSGPGAAAWDQRFSEQYGFTDDTPRTLEAWLERLREEDRARVHARFAEIVVGEGGDGWNEEFRATRSDGTTAWFHAIGRAERDPGGVVASVVGIQARHHGAQARRGESPGALRATRGHPRPGPVRHHAQHEGRGTTRQRQRGVHAHPGLVRG